MEKVWNAQNLCWEAETGGSGGSLASLDYLVNSRPAKDPVLKAQDGQSLGNNTGACPLASTHKHTCPPEHLHTHNTNTNFKKTTTTETLTLKTKLTQITAQWMGSAEKRIQREKSPDLKIKIIESTLSKK